MPDRIRPPTHNHQHNLNHNKHYHHHHDNDGAVYYHYHDNATAKHRHVYYYNDDNKLAAVYLSTADHNHTAAGSVDDPATPGPTDRGTDR